MRCLKRCIAVVMASVMVLAMGPSYMTQAAKKPVLSVKKCTVKVGDKLKIKIKNGNAKAKVTWKIKKSSIAKIVGKSVKGNKAYAFIKGVKKGKTTLTATYKYSGKTTKLNCKVTVNPVKQQKEEATMTPDNINNITSTPGVLPTAAPTEAPTETPVPTDTPVPFENLVEVSELKTMDTMPDLFTYIDGTPVTAKNWEGRAEEIRQMYQYYMYGMWRDGSGESISYNIDGNKLTIEIETAGSEIGQIQGKASFYVDVNVPAGTAPQDGWPVIICMGTLSEQAAALEAGYAVINYSTDLVAGDNSKRSGAFYTLYPYNMSEWREQTGVIMAWAWGASKILDSLFEGAGRDYGINPEYAIIGGVSRWGKATAVTGAFDTRFKIALPTCSGCGGMGVFRYNPDAKVTQEYDVSSLGYMDKATYKQGDVETIGSLQSSGEAYWFNQRFLQFRSIYQLPFDQYFLSSLYACEGRTLMLIGGFNYDIWQNTPSLWYNYQKAKPVFDMLGLSNNIIINLHDAAMGHNILNDDVVKLFKYCNEMYNGVDEPGFEISDLQTCLFEYEDTPSGINNKAVYEAQLPDR